MDAGPSTSRRGSYSLSPSSRHKHLRSTDVLSPDSPPTYHSLDTEQRRRAVPNHEIKDQDTDRLLDDGFKKGRRRSDDEGSGEDDELDALRLDLDGSAGQGIGMETNRGGSEEEEALRILNVDQRKAQWWRNTLITGLFICSW